MKVFIIFALAFLGGAIATYYFYQNRGDEKDLACAKTYEHLNPRVACGATYVISKGGYASLVEKLETLIQTKKDEGAIIEAGLYFRDLVDGPVFGINDLEDFSPASLLKLPLALTYLSIEEEKPGTIEKEIGFSGNFEMGEQHYPPSRTIRAEVPYKIKDLLYHMIVYSDNASYLLLYKYLTDQPDGNLILLETYRELGILNPVNIEDEIITVRGYGTIMRIIYNSSLLNNDLSNYLLSLLVESEFKEGIAKQLPENVKVANKFGERVLDKNLKQLHDCGIIYYEGNPYALCIMTKGYDWEKLENIIQTMSKMVYDEVDSRKIAR